MRLGLRGKPEPPPRTIRASIRNASAWTSALYFVSGQLGWFACTLSAARGFPWLGALFVLLLIAAHMARASQPFQELKLIAATALIGAVWESALGATCTWLKSRLALAALLGAVAALALGWACLLPFIAVISRHWDGVRPWVRRPEVG